jgi:GAF domain-containing protein
VSDDAATECDSRVDVTLQATCEVARALIGAHQAAMSLIVAGDWAHARKYFSLSDKYEPWKNVTMPARGVGLHALVVAENEAIRLTQHQAEEHPAWRGYGPSAGKHPPLRGLLAVPLVGEEGLNNGLLQLSDKVDGGDFDEDDQRRLVCLAELAATTLDALRKVRSLRSGEVVPFVQRKTLSSFVQIETV